MTTRTRPTLLLILPLLALAPMACAESHVVHVDGSVSDGSMGFPDVGQVDSGSVDLGGDAGRVCQDGSGLRPAAPPLIIPPAETCRTSSDCSGGTQCFGASDGFCGICQQPMRECEDDGDCGAGSWCRAESPNCCGGVDTTCVPDCGANGTACQDGEICDSATGRCERNGCLSLDMACPLNHDCDPTRADADALGCARRGCTTDMDCDCGFCVTGTCESQLGVCSFPPA